MSLAHARRTVVGGRRGCTDVVGVFPNEAAVTRLAGAILIETHDEWAIATRSYLAEHSMAKLDRLTDDGVTEEVEGARELLPAS
jgi:transposase-like protein